MPTWDGLVALLGRTDFLYVADSKLCSREAMGHIAAAGGRFVTVLPRTRGEDRWFRDWIQTTPPQWTEALRLPGARLGEPDQVYSTFPAPLPSAEGHRIVWVHSTAKAARDAHVPLGPRRGRRRRDRRPGRPPGRPEVPAQDPGGRHRGRHRGARCGRGQPLGPASPSARPSRKASAKNAAADPAPNTRYRRHTRTRHTISWNLDPDRIAYDAASDGCFPLISNDTTLTDAEVLAAYRYQPNLERRHHLLKSVQDAAPVLLHNPARIEALFCCQFLALLIGALIERQIRTAMAAAARRRHPALPRVPRLRRALHRTHRGDLRRPHPPRTAPRRPTRPDLPARAQPATPAGPPAARRPHHQLHQHLSPRRWGRILDARSAESPKQPPAPSNLTSDNLPTLIIH